MLSLRVIAQDGVGFDKSVIVSNIQIAIKIISNIINMIKLNFLNFKIFCNCVKCKYKDYIESGKQNV